MRVNDDANWTLVESKQTSKLQEKERIQNLAQFPPLHTVNEGSVDMSTETASSKRRANKINLKKIFNEDKQSSGTPRIITIKNIELILHVYQTGHLRLPWNYPLIILGGLKQKHASNRNWYPPEGCCCIPHSVYVSPITVKEIFFMD